MKALFTTILICLASVQSFADCAGSGIWVYPATTTTLSEMPFIVIEGYYRDQEVMRQIGEKYALYLDSGNEQIRLIPVEILEGEMHLTQVVLKAEQALKTGIEYELHSKSIPEKPLDIPYSIDLGIPDSKWMVEAINDKTAPLFTSAPKWVSSQVIFFGCGPANNMDFAFETNEKNNFMVKTTVTNTADDSKTTYYLHAKDGTVSVGHGMCSGAFIPHEGVQYKLEFTPFDGSWNEGQTTSCEVTYNPVNTN